MIFQNIPIKSISQINTKFKITTNSSITELVHSVKDIGVICPPILKKEDSEFIIISGFRRIQACQSCGLESVDVRTVDDNTTDLKCAQIAITDNSYQRQLNIVELSRAFNILSSLVHDVKQISKLSLSLNLPENYNLIKKIKTVVALPLNIQSHIIDNNITLSNALELMELEGINVKLADLFANFKLSVNKQKEIITFFKEISLRENKTAIEIFNESNIQNIINDSEMDRNQKAERLRYYLKERRFPVIIKAKNDFEELIQSLKLSHNTKLIPPRDFEGKVYSLNFSFTKLKELDELKNSIEKIQSNPYIKKLI
ncbi:MAG: ParB N-terminal domain-containing protein [Desulfobacterales bacterium]|nr:ParB N-terminal domain-containing protein [Desulfobacterales bacterium]